MISPTKLKKPTEMLYNGNPVYVFHDCENGDVIISESKIFRIVFTVQKADLKPIKKARTAINKVSASKKEDDKKYAEVRKLYLANHPICEAMLPGCKKSSNQVHHKSGRIGKNYIDIHTFLAVCNSCHVWIENNPLKAKELGLSVDRL